MGSPRSKVETFEVTSFDTLLRYFDEVVAGMQVLEQGCTDFSARKAMKVLMTHLGKPEFLLLFQVGDGELLGFVVVVENLNIHSEPEAVVWAMWCKSGANSREFEPLFLSWLKKRGIEKVYALDFACTKAKAKWLRSFGFHPYAIVFRKEVYE